MNLSTIRTKMIALVVCMGMVLSILLAFVSPYQARGLGQDLLDRNARYIAEILAENLALGMQARTFDEGASLAQTLETLKAGGAEEAATISSVRLWDADMRYVTGYNDSRVNGLAPSDMTRARFEETDEVIAAYMPMRDSDQTIVGYLNIDFSKRFLNDRAYDYAVFGWIVSMLVLMASIGGALFLSNMMTGPLMQVITAARAIAAGDVDQHIELQHSRDEIGMLANTFRDLIAYIKNMSNAADALSMGDLSVEVTVRSDRDILGQSFVKLQQTMQELIDESGQLIQAATEGRLSVRGDAGKFNGGYRELVEGINQTLDAMVAPVNEAITVLERVESRDLAVRMQGDYQGDFATIKNTLNTALKNLDEGLQTVAHSSVQVQSAAEHISSGSQNLAEGASEQASSLQEVSSSLQEMASMTKQNEANAKEAQGMSEGARGSSGRGMDSMKRLSDAVDKIKGSSDATAKIVQTIDEIAFQTNLLALNAAVEAARAGDAGKGFAVVAEEVRNLAMRSAEAARNTADLIDESVKSAEEGVSINEEVRNNFTEITEQINKIREVMSEIAIASEQQKLGIEEVSQAMEQSNQITHQNAANAEESASTAEELTNQAAQMKRMISQFELSVNQYAASPTPQRLTGNEAPLQPAGRQPGYAGSTNGNGHTPSDILPLDDDVLRDF